MADSRLEHLRKLAGREKRDFESLLGKQLKNSSTNNQINPNLNNSVNDDSLSSRINQSFGNPDLSMTNQEFGEYGSEIGRTGLSNLIEAQNFIPFSPFKGAGAIPKIANAAMRTGQGTAGGVAQDFLDSNNKKRLGESVVDNLGVNALVEAVPLPFRGLKQIAEHVNPQELTQSLIQEGTKLYENTGKKMRAQFRNIFNEVGGEKFTTPKMVDKFIGFSKAQTRNLFTHAENIYKELKENPNLTNLHRFKKQLANDYHKIKDNPNWTDKAQILHSMKDMVENKLKSGLEKVDKKFLTAYEDANKYATKNFYPFHASKELKTMSRGKSLTASPDKYSREIVKGIEKEKIPENHFLANALKKISEKKETGTLLKHGLGTVGGGLLGALASPGLGTAGGAAAGLAGAMSKYADPFIRESIQHPKMKALFKYLEPLYYGTARNYKQNEGK